MHVFYLISAIGFEVAGTIALKFSEGFTRMTPSLVCALGYGLSFYFLSLALKRFEVSVVYAVWSGVGTALIAVIGVAFLNESLSFAKVLSLVLIIAGVVGLNMSGAPHG